MEHPRQRSPSAYPADLRGPRHHDGVGDGGGQPDEGSDVDGAAGPFWFDAVLSGREVPLQSGANRCGT